MKYLTIDIADENGHLFGFNANSDFEKDFDIIDKIKAALSVSQLDALVIPPTKDNVSATYDKPQLKEKIESYYNNKEALIEFVWRLMNNAWTNGYNTPNYD